MVASVAIKAPVDRLNASTASTRMWLIGTKIEAPSSMGRLESLYAATVVERPPMKGFLSKIVMFTGMPAAAAYWERWYADDEPAAPAP